MTIVVTAKYFEKTDGYSNLDKSDDVKNLMNEFNNAVIDTEIVSKYNKGELFTPDQKERLKVIAVAVGFVLLGIGLLGASFFTGGLALLIPGSIIIGLGGLGTIGLAIRHKFFPPTDIYLTKDLERILNFKSPNLVHDVMKLKISIKHLKQYSFFGDNDELYKTLNKIIVLTQIFVKDVDYIKFLQSRDELMGMPMVRVTVGSVVTGNGVLKSNGSTYTSRSKERKDKIKILENAHDTQFKLLCESFKKLIDREKQMRSQNQPLVP